MEPKTATSKDVTEVVWFLPTSHLRKGKKTLVLENENIETLDSENENESDQDGSSVSYQSDSENEHLNSSGDTQHRYSSNSTIPKKYNKKDLNRTSETLNQSDIKRTFNPKDILKQLKAINSTEILKPGECTSVSRREYCREWLKHQALSGYQQDQKLFNFLASKLKPSRALESREHLKNLVSSYSYDLSYMWTESGKNKDTLYKEYFDWFNGQTIELTAPRPIDIQPTSNVPDKLERINIETNADAFKFLKNLKQPFKADGLIKLIPCTDLTPEQKAKLSDFCNSYVADMKFKWLTSNNNEGVFFKKFECWLKLNIKWPLFLKDVLPTPNKTDTETVSNKEFNIPSDISEELVMELILNSNIDTVEKILASKCSESGKNISKLIHRVIHHPEDAALIASVIPDGRECNCYPKLADKKIPNKLKKFKPPSQAQKAVLKMTVERLKDSMPTPKDHLNEVTTESPFHKKRAAPGEAHKNMLNRILSKLKIANPSVKKEVNRVISKVSANPIVIHSEDDEIETYEANERGDKIFKCKVVSPAKTNIQLNQPTVRLNTVTTASEGSFHYHNEEMIVDTPIPDDSIDNTIDSDDNFETPIEQTNENNHEKLEFGPVLDKLIFIQQLNLPHGTLIMLAKNKEARICNVSNCTATVLVPTFIKKSGRNVRVRKSNYKIKRLKTTTVKKNTASSKTNTEKQISSNKNHRILQDSQERQEQESLVQVQNASRNVSGDTKSKKVIASVKFKPPSQAQKHELKMTVERLKNSMPKHAAPKYPLNEVEITESPIHKKQAAPAEAYKTMLKQGLSIFKVANLPVPNPGPIGKEVNQTDIISKVNNPIVIHDEDEEIDSYQAKERGNQILKGVVFQFKVTSKPNKQPNQQTVSHNTVIPTAVESLHNSIEEMIVDTPLHDDIIIDSYDSFETPTENVPRT